MRELCGEAVDCVIAAGRHAGRLEPASEGIDGFEVFHRACRQALAMRSMGVQDGGVVAAAEARGRWPAGVSSVSSRATYMATWRAKATRGVRSRARSSARLDPEAVGGGLLDLARRVQRGFAVARGRAARAPGGRGRASRALATQRRVGDHADERALERAHAGAHVAGDLGERLVGHAPRARRCARACGGSPCGRRSRAARARRRGPSSKRSWRRASKTPMSRGLRSLAITSWRARLVERVEGVEELLLGPHLLGEELDVVDQQHVGAAEALAEGLGVACRASPDERRGELLDGRVAHASCRRRRPGRSCRSRAGGASCRGPGVPWMKSGL